MTNEGEHMSEELLYCKFCGNSVMPVGKAERAEDVCSCEGAKKYRWRKERIHKLGENIHDAILGDGVETVYGDESLSDKVGQLIETAGIMMIDGFVDNVSMKVGDTSIKLQRSGDYAIYIKRSKKKETIVGE